MRRLPGHFLALLIALASATGCATINFDYPKTESFAITDTNNTALARRLAGQVSGRPLDQSGFFPVHDGLDSLALRLLMAERAERSIDAQYFLIRDDLAGNMFIDALLRAANRGVRVRFLVDDMQTVGYDAGFAALDSHQNLELRIFNPFAHRETRGLDVGQMNRITRRMHNKSFTVDNQMTLIGGRNIADEYFNANKDENLADLDVLAIGPVVQEVSTMFDSYWNHRASLPIPALAGTPDDPDHALDTLHKRVSESLREVETGRYSEALRSSILDFIEGDADTFIWACYELVFDSPDKSQPGAVESARSMTNDLRASITSAEHELFIVTPYFVLRDENIEGFRRLRERGVEVRVLTNSLASNNHTMFHSGYAPARVPLLEMGVRIHELRVDAELEGGKRGDVESAKSTLHAKAFAIDRERAFIGSFNWTQRSVHLDTEMGVIIHSPRIASALVERASAAMETQSYELFLDEAGELRWRGLEDGDEVILTNEPQTSFWRRLNADFLGLLPFGDQL